MKIKVVLATMLCLFAATACTKKDISSDGNKFYMRFKVDNSQKEFIYTTAYFSGVAKFTSKNSHVSINGGTNDNTGNAFTININNTVDAPLKAGDSFKVNEIIPGPNGTPSCYLSYAVNNPAAYNYGSWLPDIAERPVYETTVKIDELDETHVKGNFSGKIREAKGSKLITITDGEFLVERQ